MRPGAPITAREVLELLPELPDGSALIASIKASTPPEATESEAVVELRARRRWRGWTVESELLAQIRDTLLGGKNPYPRPGGPSGGAAGPRRVIDLDELPTIL